MVIFHSCLYVYQRFYPTKTDQIHAENPLKSTDHRSCDLRTAQFPGGPASVREELRDRLEIFEAQLGWEIPWKSMAIYGNLWKSLETYGNLWKPMEIYGNLWKSIWKSMENGIWSSISLQMEWSELFVHPFHGSCIHCIKKTPESPWWMWMHPHLTGTILTGCLRWTDGMGCS